MSEFREPLEAAARRAGRYLAELPQRSVQPSRAALGALDEFDGPLPEAGLDPASVLELLDRAGSPATMASAGPRYFGFVIGGVLPAALAANWLAGAWDQNAFSAVASPACAAIERTAERWVLELLGFPSSSAVGFTTGATAANVMGLAAARSRLLERHGWNVAERGLFGAPEIRVVVGAEFHASLKKALALVGLGYGRVEQVPVDGQGRLRVDGLPALDASTIVCLQAGNVNTGAFDPAAEVLARAREAGAWVHADGAFGLWALACPGLAELARGFEAGDSAAVDGPKGMNVPYDSGMVLVRDPESLRAALSVSAAYLPSNGQREPYDLVPEMSRRGRGVELWAAMRSLGRSGVAELVERCCRHARRFAEGLEAAGHRVLNEVTLNQVLVSFGTPERTRAVIDAVQAEGICWVGGTSWQGHTAMRISVSAWNTTAADVEASLGSILGAATEAGED